MNESKRAEPQDDPCLPRQVDQLLSKYVSDPQSPRPEEVQRMVGELLLRRSELEAEIREHRDTHKQLEAYRDRYVDLYDFAPLGYVTLDEEGYIQEINLAGARLLGGELAELVGYPVIDYVVAPDQAAFLGHIQKCCGQQQDVTSELGLIAKDGRLVVVQFRSVPVKALEHEGTFCKTAITDITERKQAEDAIQAEHNLLRTLIDNLPDSIYVKDTQGRFVAANLPAAHIMGAVTPNDLLGKTDYDFYPKERAAEYGDDEQRVLRSGQPLVNKDEPHLDPTGTPRAVLTTKVPLKDGEGQVIGLVGISRDITDRKRTEEELARERANLQAVFDVVNVGMLVIDEDGAVKQVNDTLSRWVRKDVLTWEGGQPGDFVGCVHVLADAAGCGHSPHCTSCPIRNTFTSVLQTGQPVHDVEAEAILSIGGSEVPLWLEVSADPLVLDGKRHVILAMNNITARKRDEETLQQTAEELARSNKDLEQFASVVSHDLQEPLRTVSGFVQLLQKKYANQLDAEADTFIEYAVDGTKRMEVLIKDLLAYARVTSRSGGLVPTDTGAALRQALSNLQASIQEAGAEIIYSELPTVRADPSQLAQLFQNLLGNAMKFRSKAPPKICVDARREGDYWRFSVRDNGIGIDSKCQDQVFEVFRRLHTSKQYAGTGIGLAICKKIVDRHGGRIWVESEPGQGATFHFTISI